MKQLKKTLLTLVALLAVTTGAWAQTETLLTTITPTGDASYSETTTGVVTVALSNVGFFSEDYGWCWFESGSVTVEAKEGYTITRCVFKQNDKTPVTITTSPFAITFNNDDGHCEQNLNDYMNGVTSIEVYGYTSASSGPEVAWDKAKNSGSFKMPGGNVTLEPEYYPQAALAAAPTAINDVPATTDGAIVEAGTVKNIGETATAQGTVMYYVSQTALDDAALLALAADQWKADVPTAAGLAQGQAYVYYYVRGNDGDTDEEIFSDGDIKALTVTIAPEPTYAVTFAEGTNTDEWKASPAAGVTKGQTVTVTYNGTKKVIGVKAEKKAKASAKPLANATAEDLGKIAGADGNIYDSKDAAEAANTTAVAMIAYVGSSTDHATYKHGLALALSNEGSMNWTTAKSTCEGKSAVTNAAWQLPSKDQWTNMINACKNVLGTKNNYQDLRDGFSGISGASNLQSDEYWSRTEYDSGYAWVYDFGSGSCYEELTDDNFRVRACLAF